MGLNMVPGAVVTRVPIALYSQGGQDLTLAGRPVTWSLVPQVPFKTKCAIVLTVRGPNSHQFLPRSPNQSTRLHRNLYSARLTPIQLTIMSDKRKICTEAAAKGTAGDVNAEDSVHTSRSLVFSQAELLKLILKLLDETHYGHLLAMSCLCFAQCILSIYPTGVTTALSWVLRSLPTCQWILERIERIELKAARTANPPPVADDFFYDSDIMDISWIVSSRLLPPRTSTRVL